METFKTLFCSKTTEDNMDTTDLCVMAPLVQYELKY